MAIDKTVLTTNIKDTLQPLLKTEYENAPSVTIIHAQIDSPENTAGGAMSSSAPSPNATVGVSYFTVGNTLEQTISGASGIITDIEGDDIASVNQYQRPLIDDPGRYLFSDTGGKFSGDANTVLDGGRVVIRDIGSTTVERTLTHTGWSSLIYPFPELSFTLGEIITQSVTGASGVVVESTTDDTIFKDLLTGTWGISNDVTGGSSGRVLTASNLSIVSGAWDVTEDIIEKDASKTEIITTLSAAKIHSLTLNPRGTLETSTTMAQAIATPVADKVIDLIDEYNLITTGTDTINTTLPSASAYSGRVLKFIKADSGTGKVSIDRAGSDTLGINSVTSMELWFQGNYVHLMSDGISKWYVVGTQHVILPAENRPTTGTPNSTTTLSTWTDNDYSSLVPAGTCYINVLLDLVLTGDGTTDTAVAHIRKNGSSESASDKTLVGQVEVTNLASSILHADWNDVWVECDSGRIFEHYITRNAGVGTVTFSAWVRGYRLG